MLEGLEKLLAEYPTLAPLLFIVARMIPVLFAPIPGVAVDVIGIALFGWLYGLFLAEIAILLGSMTAFFIGRYFKEPLVQRFASLQKVPDWESKYSDQQTFWALVSMRLVTSPFFDYVSYAAGLTNIKPGLYFSTTLIGTFPIMFSIYYFGGIFISESLSLFSVFIVVVCTMLFVWKNAVKNRHKESL